MFLLFISLLYNNFNLKYYLNTFLVLFIMELINKKYRIIGKIGEGTFGFIYKGENIRTRELVAIKVEPIEHELK